MSSWLQFDKPWLSCGILQNMPPEAYFTWNLMDTTIRSRPTKFSRSWTGSLTFRLGSEQSRVSFARYLCWNFGKCSPQCKFLLVSRILVDVSSITRPIKSHKKLFPRWEQKGCHFGLICLGFFSSVLFGNSAAPNPHNINFSSILNRPTKSLKKWCMDFDLKLHFRPMFQVSFWLQPNFRHVSQTQNDKIRFFFFYYCCCCCLVMDFADQKWKVNGCCLYS